jgi:membrane fusion protein, copper/silver efflux system
LRKENYHMNKIKKWGVGIGIVALVLAIGYSFITRSQSSTSKHEQHPSHTELSQMWTCAMHPQVKRDKAGRCPICGMDLVPVYKEVDDAPTQQRLQLSPRAEKLAEVDVSPVTRAFATETLRLSGKLVVDETRLETISAWFPGRIETLFIDYTGITVEKNTHMAKIFSPDLLVAQKELLEAVRSGSSALRSSSREKLRLWGLSPSQIKDIETTGHVSDTVSLRTDIGGTVLKKYVNKGDYVDTGSKIYDLANLDRLWFVAEVYESDVSKLYYGQKAHFITLAYPSESYDVVITFIDPVVDPKSRTIRIRGIVDNADGKLKPEMLAKATLSVMYSKTGPIQRSDDSKDQPLLIPDTAPLITGERAIVYVKVPDKAGIYEGRDVLLGAKVGNVYIVKEGLAEGELVVTKGNFKIDSAMQIQAKPSMMQSK